MVARANRIDAESLVKKYGGRTRLLRLLTQYDPTVPARLTVRGIDKWVQRQKVPGDWLVAIANMHIAEFGEPLDLSQFTVLAS